MHIILDHSFSSTTEGSPSSVSLSNLMVEMAARHHEDLFTVLSNSTANTPLHLPSNIKFRPVKTGGWKLAGWKWWKRFMLPGVVKKLGGELLVTTDAQTLPACPCKICLFELREGSSARQLPGQLMEPARGLLIKNLEQADGVITLSAPRKEFLQSLFPARAGMIHVLQPAPLEEIQPLRWTDKENVKVQYTGGREYFVYTGELEDDDKVYLLLRAFARFKKRQLSNMQLVLAADTTSSTSQFLEKLSSFKYRADVHVFKNPGKEVLLRLIAASYAFVGEGLTDEFQLNTQRAIHAGVPVIKAVDTSGESTRGYGIMYTQAATEQELADGMQLIYKDENLRAELIQTARRHIESGEKYDLVEACRQLLKVILQTKSQ
jgi:glycosyltransferase involved in cell wall biosynthesis